VWYKLIDVSQVLTASIITATTIALMMVDKSTYGTSVNFYQTT
jgi:hypothetical protein